MNEETARKAAVADVSAAIDEARDIAERRFGSAARPEVVMAIAAELLAAYRWHQDQVREAAWLAE